jgi:3-isopropylmalate/(R)-2-methylmalate dehydratase small subunit
MSLIWSGRAWLFGDDVPNDEGIMPLRMVRQQEYDPAVLSTACFEQVNTDFAGKATHGDVVIAGRNFGYGNPHIQGFLGLKGLGVAVLAESMSRGPLRACVNAGVPVLLVSGAAGFARDGDKVCINFETGQCVNETSGAILQGSSLPPVMREIISCGGGIEYMKKALAAPRL